MDYLENKIPHTSRTQDTPIWIDTDNALGSYFGDIDDAIALATLVKSGHPILAVSNVFGNTFQKISYTQTAQLLKILNVSLPHYSGADTWWSTKSEASEKLSQVNQKFKILALGPLTNIATALKMNPKLQDYIEEIIFVGTNYSIQLPNWRFFDFNVFKDKKAAFEVIKSGVPIKLIPCDQARKVRLTALELKNVGGHLGAFLNDNSKRWFRRAKWLKLQKSIPVWDLTAALYLLQPKQFKFKYAIARQTYLNQLHIQVTNEMSSVETLHEFNIVETKNTALLLLA